MPKSSLPIPAVSEKTIVENSYYSWPESNAGQGFS
jgi:hypothetical protein